MGQHALEHLGATQNDTQRITQVMGHHAENFVFEGIGALQLQPARREPMIGAGQVARAIRYPLLQLRIGILQLLIKDDIVEGHRKTAGKDLDQRAVGSRQLAWGFQQHHHFASAGGLYIESAIVRR